MKTKNIRIIYWICLGLTILVMGSSAFMQIMQTNEHFLQEMEKMGYPLYFLRFLGIAKLIGIVAIVVPGFPRLREWAYAGFVITLIGAIYSHLVIGVVEPPHFIILGILFTSYFMWHKLQKSQEPVSA